MAQEQKTLGIVALIANDALNIEAITTSPTRVHRMACRRTYENSSDKFHAPVEIY